MRKVLRRFQAYLPTRLPTSGVERLRACGGAMLGIFLTGTLTRLILGPGAALALIPPMGASAVLLFALPASPLAQPWSIVVGNIVSATIGVTCAHLIHNPLLAAVLALPLAIGAMFALRCLHPPGGAIALSAIIGEPSIKAAGYGFAVSPVGLNSMLLLLIALVYNNITRHRYPHLAQPDHSNTHGTKDALPRDRLGFTPADLDAVLKQYNEVLDISRDDLEALFLKTEMHAYRRRFGEITCGDIMSRDIVAIEYGTTLQEAWTLLRKHKVKALPVVDGTRHLIGIVTFVDFMKNANLDVYDGFDVKLRQFIRRATRKQLNKPEVVGQIMTKTPRTARIDMHIVDLVPLLSDLGLHHIPIIDREQRLAGMVTQSDLIAALYRGRLGDMAEAA